MPAAKDKLYLYIESLEPKKIKVVVFNDVKILRQKEAAVFSDKILEAIDSLFGGRKKLFSCQAIVVHQGPGTFGAVRSAVLLANTLGALLAIPVRAVRDEF